MTKVDPLLLLCSTCRTNAFLPLSIRVLLLYQQCNNAERSWWEVLAVNVVEDRHDNRASGSWLSHTWLRSCCRPGLRLKGLPPLYDMRTDVDAMMTFNDAARMWQVEISSRLYHSIRIAALSSINRIGERREKALADKIARDQSLRSVRRKRVQAISHVNHSFRVMWLSL